MVNHDDFAGEIQNAEPLGGVGKEVRLHVIRAGMYLRYSLVPEKYQALDKFICRLHAFFHSYIAVRKNGGFDTSLYKFSANDLYILALTFLRSPKPLRNVEWAHVCLKTALDSKHEDNMHAYVSPYKRAVLLVVMAEVRELMDAPKEEISKYYDEAISLKEYIYSTRNKRLADREWMEVAFAAGKWYYDQMINPLGISLIAESRVIARSIASKDLNENMWKWLSKRRLHI